MKCGPILVQFMRTISNPFLSLLQRLEISSRHFYDFDKIAVIKCDLLIFSRSCLLFLIILVHTFKRVNNHKVIIIGF